MVLRHPPIVEAVVDLDCDLPPAFDLKALEDGARQTFAGRYPKSRVQVLHQHQIEHHGDAPLRFSARQGLQALQFLTDDEKEVVQVRAQGYSFNRLAPYTTLDDYQLEIEASWLLYCRLVNPLQVRVVRLRYINRIRLPLDDGRIKFSDYLVGSSMRAPKGLSLRGFLNQHVAVEEGTGNEVNLVVAAQPPEERVQPVILDITASARVALDPQDWPSVVGKVESLRRLKNFVFRSTLTKRCLNLFQ